MRTLALFAADNQDQFLDVFLKDGRLNKQKGIFGKRMTDGRLKDLLSEYDPKVSEVYDTTSGFVHFSAGLIPSMSEAEDADYHVRFNFGGTPNASNNGVLLECGYAFIHFVDLHLQMLAKAVQSDDWYADRMTIHNADNDYDNGDDPSRS